MKKDKKYDAVEEARKIREKLSIKYWNHTDQLKKDLEVVRKKYARKAKKEKSEKTH